MKKSKLKTLSQFQSDIRESVAWNSRIGFWHVILHEIYVRGNLKYSEALADAISLGNYKGA